MSRVSITQLKAKLSQYLREVERGGEVIVLNRDTPIARITPVTAEIGVDEDSQRSRLVRDGILRPGTGDAARILDLEPISVEGGLSGALSDEREDRT